MKILRQLGPIALVAASAVLFGACGTAKPVPEPAPTAVVETPAAPEPVKPADIRIDVVGVSDTHGWAMTHDDRLPDGSILKTGGLATFAGYVNILRKQLPDGVVLVDAGDDFQGTLLSNLFEGQSVVEAMNLMDFDAMAVGNHEFDYGPVGPKAIAGEGDDPLGALKAVAASAKHPVLSYNLRNKADGRIPEGLDQKGFTIVERQGVKIGIVGLTTPSTIGSSNPANLKDVQFRDLVSSSIEGAQAAKEAGAEVLVGVFHEGNSCKSLKNPNDLSSCDIDRGLIKALSQMPTGLFDVVVGGDSHARIGHFVNGMAVIQSAAQLRNFGVVELTLDGETHRPVAGKTVIRSSIPVCQQVIRGQGHCNTRWLKADVGVVLEDAVFEGETVVPDAAVAEVVARYEAKVAEKKAESLDATVAEPMYRSYRSESALGNAMSDVLRQSSKADFAMLNSGGLRVDLPAGPMTYGTLYEILPFDNMTATLKLTGAELAEMFGVLFSSTHGVPQVSGMKMTVEICTDGAHVTKMTDAKGRKVNLKDNKKVYTVATSDFMASGGDGLKKFLQGLPEGKVDTGAFNEKTMRDEIADAIRAAKKFPAPGVDGRITLAKCSDPSKVTEVAVKYE